MPKTRKTAAERAEYRRQWMKMKRTVHKPVHTSVHKDDGIVHKSVHREEESVHKSVNNIPWVTGADLSMFDGHGRGEPVNGLVMVARRSPTLVRGEYVGELVGVLPETVWRQRLDDVCAHGLRGWSCKPCLA